MSDYSNLNRPLWDHWAQLHSTHKSDYYDLDAFKAGKNTLNQIELDALGDVSGKSLLHLQCHIGLDTLSWARLGAEVTGIDFSPEAIKVARELATAIGQPTATFIESDIYALPGVLDEQFDIVFTSYGVITWLNDIDAWGDIVARYLKPGGKFYVVDFHPFMYTVEFDQTLTPRIGDPYFARDALVFKDVTSYASGEHSEPHDEYAWQHPLGSIITALAKAGLRIESVEELPYTTSPLWSCLEKDDAGLWWPKMGKGSVPLMFSITATK